MKTLDIHDYARKLLEAHGDKAEYEAVQKAHKKKQEGDEKQAGDWIKIREAIQQMRGPHES